MSLIYHRGNKSSLQEKHYVECEEELLFLFLAHRDAFSGTLFLHHRSCVWVICIIFGTNTNLGLLASAPEEHNLPLDCSLSGFGFSPSITRLIYE